MTTPDGRSPEAPGSSAPPNPGAVLGWVGVGVALLVGVLGMVLGAISISRSRRVRASITPGVLAVVIGVLQLLAIITVVLVALVRSFVGEGLAENPGDTPTAQPVSVTSLAPGNCLDLATLDVDTVTQLPCSQEHDGEILTQTTISGNAYPGQDALYEQVIDQCATDAQLMLPPATDPTRLYVDALVPTLAEWDAGHRQTSCLLGSTGATMRGSATAGDLIVY